MSKNKKQIRAMFRDAVFSRDNHKCRGCNKRDCFLDAHHITNRKEMPNGGYVLENGITLCEQCHIKAEVYHSTGIAVEYFSPTELYCLIKSSYEIAYEKSTKL